jgi:hypothetical protein
MKFHTTVRQGTPLPLHSDRDRPNYCTSETLTDNIVGLGAYAEVIENGFGEVGTDMPPLLYKYRGANIDEKSLRHLRQLIVLDTAYISNFKDFNDPFEGRFKLKLANAADVYESTVSQLRKDTALSRTDRRKEARRLTKAKVIGKEIAQQVDSYIENNIGILCLSINPSSVLMWSHYASEHRGILLEYDTSKEPFFHLGDHVAYEEEFPEITIPASNPKLPFLQKSIEWKYEEEFRIITRVTRCGVQLKSDCLTGIIFGARCSPTLEKKVKDMLVERQSVGKPLPSLKRARLSQSEYIIKIDND